MTTQNWHHDTAIAVEDKTIDQQLQAADLDWTVEMSGFRYGDRYQHRQSETQVAFRSDTGMFIDTYTNRQPWQNREIIENFHHFCSESDLDLKVENIGSLENGKRLFAAAKLPGVTDVKNVGDVTEWRLLLEDSHINGNGLQVSLFSNRLICTNGMRQTIRVGNKTVSHVGTFNRDRINQLLEAAIVSVRQQEQEFEKLAEVTMSIEEATLQLVSAFGHATLPIDQQPQMIQTALKLFQGQAKGSDLLSAYKTAYGLLQSVTEYFNWHAPQRGTSQTQFASVLSGNRGQKMSQFERQLVSVYC